MDYFIIEQWGQGKNFFLYDIHDLVFILMLHWKVVLIQANPL